jgi:hypothetical protein
MDGWMDGVLSSVSFFFLWLSLSVCAFASIILQCNETCTHSYAYRERERDKRTRWKLARTHSWWMNLDNETSQPADADSGWSKHVRSSPGRGKIAELPNRKGNPVIVSLNTQMSSHRKTLERDPRRSPSCLSRFLFEASIFTSRALDFILRTCSSLNQFYAERGMFIQYDSIKGALHYASRSSN